VEYLLRTFVETFLQPVLRQLIQLEQAYETDQVIIGLAAKKAALLQKYGINQITDELLEKELTLSVNVGMGATDPSMKLQKFVAAMTSYANMAKEHIPGVNMQEVGKEIFGHLGYSDGTRFFTSENPQVLQLQQQVQQLGKVNEQLKLALQSKEDKHLVEIHKATLTNKTKLEDRVIHEAHEDKRNEVTHLRAMVELQAKQRHEVTMHKLQGGKGQRTMGAQDND
jgi:hypothetical protein